MIISQCFGEKVGLIFENYLLPSIFSRCYPTVQFLSFKSSTVLNIFLRKVFSMKNIILMGIEENDPQNPKLNFQKNLGECCDLNPCILLLNPVVLPSDRDFWHFSDFNGNMKIYGWADIPNRVLFEKSLSDPTAEDLCYNMAKYADNSIKEKRPYRVNIFLHIKICDKK